ncbi:transcriptional regulator [Nostoc sp. UCD121]|uniref:helix-turn-helix domain-containing protein n=1 Tax=unclassified Nostoc TaxID=2593658 RepID=UPI001629B54A|nr:MULTISPECIES: transcriptional regulator [unclassified Nostoc]MBC1221514.1 transcriptional regulator [Nostoc sp. UCD120]MBC1276642.1 transcriptional regulator [Nostoc sp. UCD121]MBC1294250.1 transcriptional regulator [Nostoc sp. UCD122]
MNTVFLKVSWAKSFPPRPITSEEEFLATQEVIDSLIDKGELTPDEQDYLNVLGTLVYEYEQKYYSIPDIHGVELLQALIAEFGFRQKDLIPIFQTESIVAEVLSGQRKLTVNHISKFTEFFHISPAACFES